MRSDQTAKIVGWLITPFYVFVFFLILLFFHPLLVAAGTFSRAWHRYLLNVMNFFLLTNIRSFGTASISIERHDSLPPDRPVVLISNHQSMYDIPLIMWILRSRRTGFVAKKELGRWLPSISYSLRHLDSVLIDRKNSEKALEAIRDWGSAMQRISGVACIFPEGTRARNGVMKKFKASGTVALLEAMPEAVVQPVLISGAWELLRYGFLPVPWGVRIRCVFLPSIERSTDSCEEMAAKVEGSLKTYLTSVDNLIASGRGTPRKK